MIFVCFVWLFVGICLGYLLCYFFNRLGITSLKKSLEVLTKELIERQNQVKVYQENYVQVSKELACSITHNGHLEEKLKEQGYVFAQMQEQMTLHFKQLANELLEEKNKKFADHSQLQLERLLMPLREQLSTFEQHVIQSNQDNLARNVALRTELKQLHELNIKITHEAENLTKAIKGNTKLQGGWGEFILENILERSGLVKNREYIIQPAFCVEDGKRYQPDVVVNLPGNKHIIIDSKVSLTHYERFFNADNETQRHMYLKQHVDSLRRHMKLLSGKNYQLLYNFKGLDFVFMFVPIESAFIFAIQESMELFYEAYEQNIIIVSPSNLMATLRTIANLWKQQYQHDHVVEIAQQGGALFDKFVAFVSDMKSIGRQLDLTQKSYDQAMKKLYDGKGSLVSRAQKMKQLGLRTHKSLDQPLDKAQEEL